MDSYEILIGSYLKNSANDLMYQNPDTIKKACMEMKNNIENYAKENCKVYESLDLSFIYTKQELSNKESWISKSLPSKRIINQHTSGSTSGEPFNYYNDKKYFDFIQRSSEFDLILKEYELYNKPLKILNLFNHSNNPKIDNFFLETHNYSQRKFHNYGASDATTYFINFDSYMSQLDSWDNQLLEFLSEYEFDIVLSSGPVVNRIAEYIKKHNFKKHFCYLLSHTSEFPLLRDFEFLKSNGNISYNCDHMRCWDGGASFFTCKNGTYHLNDNFAWTIEGPDHKMISTDYFNLASPFINYWNGDLCEIKENYELCSCGRYYRPFKMLQNRPFALKGTSKLIDIKQQISQLSFKKYLIQIQFENLSVRISSSRELSYIEKEILQNILKEYEIFWK
jgi:phenylacetate-coenzyme A ligase PaaK-like adenylate-forming protein